LVHDGANRLLAGYVQRILAPVAIMGDNVTGYHLHQLVFHIADALLMLADPSTLTDDREMTLAKKRPGMRLNVEGSARSAAHRQCERLNW